VGDDGYPAGGERGDHHRYQRPGRGLAMRVAPFWDVPVLDLFLREAALPEGKSGSGPAIAQLAAAPRFTAPIRTASPATASVSAFWWQSCLAVPGTRLAAGLGA
jgi:hypothetical protein